LSYWVCNFNCSYAGVWMLIESEKGLWILIIALLVMGSVTCVMSMPANAEVVEDKWTPIDKYWVYQPEFQGVPQYAYTSTTAEIRYFIVCENQDGKIKSFKATIDEWYGCRVYGDMYRQGGF
jgi:hypothetical protein